MTGYMHRTPEELARVRLVNATAKALGIKRADLAAYLGTSYGALQQRLGTRGQARMSAEVADFLIAKIGELARARQAIVGRP